MGRLATGASSRGNLLLPLVTFVLILCFAGLGRTEETTKIDFQAVSKYVSEWSARDAFPDSPSFAYQNVYCQLALNGRVNDTDRKRVTEFLKKSQRADGGFVSNPELESGSNVIFTYFALATLDLLGAPETIDRDHAVGFILSLALKDGGIKGTAKDAKANLGTTYYGVRALSLLGALDRLEKGQVVAYILSHRDGNKGFGVLPGKPSAPQSTFMAVESLRLLGAMSESLKPGVIGFLKETPYSGWKDPENQALMNMENEANVLETASILSATRDLNLEKILGFIESLYIPEMGGFGPSPGYGATPPSTYSAIFCLVKLGKLKDPSSLKR